CPPWGSRSGGPLNVRIGDKELSVRDDYGHLLILGSCLHLSETGIGVFIVTDAFFLNRKAICHLCDHGIHVTDAIQLPSGTFNPLTSISTHIVVIRRTADSTVFTGKYAADPEHQTALIKN